MVCLTPEEIADYLQGRLPDQRSEDIEEHLSQCDRCEVAARNLDGTADSLVNHLRISPDAPVPDDPSLAGRLEGCEFAEMLAAADLLDGVTRAAASEFLHGYLEQQLRARQSIQDPSVFDESTMWISYTVQTLAAVDGEDIQMVFGTILEQSARRGG